MEVLLVLRLSYATESTPVLHVITETLQRQTTELYKI